MRAADTADICNFCFAFFAVSFALFAVKAVFYRRGREVVDAKAAKRKNAAIGKLMTFGPKAGRIRRMGLFGIPTVNDPAVDAGSNRLSTGDGYAFDGSGNTTGDAEGRTFVYDAENKQTSVSDANGVIGQYWYDGDGRRVKKYVPSTGETTVFVYDASGKLAAEYSTVVAAANDSKVAYLTADHLGSPRINTDQNGTVTARHDYHPFGEEIDGTGGRTTALGYPSGNDGVRKQFTSYERDNETDLDFAQARMYANRLGRFTSTDPLLNSGRPNVPQSWNRYLYAANSPIKYNDQTGLFEWDETLKDDPTKGEKENKRRAKLRDKIIAGYDKAKAEIEKAMKAKKLSEDKLAKLNNALNALGPKPGEAGSNNGVTVGIGEVADGGQGQTTPTFRFDNDLNNVSTISVKFTEKLVNSEGLFAGLVHEGSHVFNMSLFAGDMANAMIGKSKYDLTQYQSEYKAYEVNSYLFEAMGVNGSKYDIPVWNNDWKKVDEELPSAINKAISGYKDGYDRPITPTNQGQRYEEYGIKRKQ